MMGTIALLLIIFVIEINAHGYLREPPARNSMWKLGYKTKPYYNLNELNCGGFHRQWMLNDGKCGVCGDPYDALAQTFVHDRDYVTDLRPRKYQAGDTIDVVVVITANHLGYFTFKLGRQTGTYIKHEDLTQDLQVVHGSTLRDRFPIGSESKAYSFKVKLPDDYTCDHCVFQWTYRGGNNYGCDGTLCGKGYGKQEHFVNCADVVIESRSTQTVEGTTTPMPTFSTTHTPMASTTAKVTTTTGSTQSSTNSDWFCRADSTLIAQYGDAADFKCNNYCQKTAPDCELKGCSCTRITKPVITTQTRCVGVNLYYNVPDMNQWCTVHCNAGYCPESHCICGDNTKMSCKAQERVRQIPGADSYCQSECDKGTCHDVCQCTREKIQETSGCVAAGAYEGQAGMTAWCQTNCPLGNCPASHCKCS